MEELMLAADVQRLRLLPELGGSVASWEWKTVNGWTPVFRPWDGESADRYSFACFPLVPWSNRISGGGFAQDGIFHAVRANRLDEHYPIHGDGWLQAWKIAEQDDRHVRLELRSNRFDADPYVYEASESFVLHPDGLGIELSVTHRGERPLPYGLGLHPYFPCNPKTRLQFKADGVWLSGKDPIPIEHSSEFPPTWDYNQAAPLDGPLIDNCYTGWDGRAVIEYPDRGFSLTMTMVENSGYTLLYRAPGMPFFCLEPITHPINAFHMHGRPGLVHLSRGESLRLRARFTVAETQRY